MAKSISWLSSALRQCIPICGAARFLTNLPTLHCYPRDLTAPSQQSRAGSQSLQRMSDSVKQDAGEARLVGEQLRLQLQAAAVPRERAIGADEAMARDDQRQRIGAIGMAHRAGGMWASEVCGQRAIAAGFAERNLRKRLPDGALPDGADERERQIEDVSLAAMIFT